MNQFVLYFLGGAMVKVTSPSATVEELWRALFEKDAPDNAEAEKKLAEAEEPIPWISANDLMYRADMLIAIRKLAQSELAELDADRTLKDVQIKAMDQVLKSHKPEFPQEDDE